MVNYQNGKIYYIVNNFNQNQYIGSTTKKYLTQRLSEHRKDSKRNNTRTLMKEMQEFGCENFAIFLLENFPCNSKDELHTRERYWINERNPLLNMIKKVVRTKEEELEYYKEIAKTDKRKEQNKKSYEKNKNKIIQRKKEYYEKNKDKIIQQQKEYYEKNKDIINEKRRVKK